MNGRMTTEHTSMQRHSRMPRSSTLALFHRQILGCALVVYKSRLSQLNCNKQSTEILHVHPYTHDLTCVTGAVGGNKHAMI